MLVLGLLLTAVGSPLTRPAAGLTVETLAGTGAEGSTDGPVSEASLSEPISMAVQHTSTGDRVYFTEYGGERIKNLTRCTAGGYQCANVKIAAPGCLNAPGRNYTGDTNSCDCGCDVYFMMGSGHRVRVLDDDVVRTVAGSGIRGYRNGHYDTAEFNHPYDVIITNDGSLLIADSHNHVVRRLDLATGMVSTVAGNGKIGWRDHGVSTQAGFNYPTGLAIDRGTKTIYVSDRSNNCIRAIADIGNGAVTTVAGNCRAGTWGHRDGEAAEALFSGPTALVLDRQSDARVLYVTDIANNCVRTVNIGLLAADPDAALTVGTLVPSLGGDHQLDQPTGIAMDPATATLYVSSYIGGRILAFHGVDGDKASMLEHLAGSGAFGFKDGSAEGAAFRGVKGLGWSAATDTLYVADLFNSRIRKTRLAAASRAVAVPAAGGLRTRRAIPAAPLSAMEQLRRSTTPGEPLRVMLWTGHSGPYHDHFHNGAVLAEALRATGHVTVALPCTPDQKVHCEAVFANPDLNKTYDVILIYADTYENPLRGSMTDAEWDGMFSFVKGGGGFFALHTASACWDNKVEHPTDPRSEEFHHMLNCEFGGHSPYKDYIGHIVDAVDDPITQGMGDYIVSDELYHPLVYNRSRSTIFIEAYDQQLNTTAVHGLRHAYGKGRVLYFAEGHDMAEFVNAGEFPDGNHAFQQVILRCLLWLAKLI